MQKTEDKGVLWIKNPQQKQFKVGFIQFYGLGCQWQPTPQFGCSTAIKIAITNQHHYGNFLLATPLSLSLSLSLSLI